MKKNQPKSEAWTHELWTSPHGGVWRESPFVTAEREKLQAEQRQKAEALRVSQAIAYRKASANARAERKKRRRAKVLSLFKIWKTRVRRIPSNLIIEGFVILTFGFWCAHYLGQRPHKRIALRFRVPIAYCKYYDYKDVQVSGKVSADELGLATFKDEEGAVYHIQQSDIVEEKEVDAVLE